MSEEMRILDCEPGALEALVLCTVCGEISRQRLLYPYKSAEPAYLAQPYTCPACRRTFYTCRPAVVSVASEAPSGGPISSIRPILEARGLLPAGEGAGSGDDAAALPQNARNDALDRRIEFWKRELLDTGKRNRMINYRETRRSTLQILEPEASQLFNRLAFSEKPLTFQKPISKTADLRTYAVISLMETLSYSLDVQTGDIKAAGTVMEREKTLKNLRAKAKLAREEQGANILYLCFGFIYWRERGRSSGPWIKSPLLMMPAALGQKTLNSPYTLSRYDDEIEVNPTLDYFFNSEYRVDLPAFELKNRSSVDEYFTLVGEFADRQGWKLTREVSLGLVSFLKISMYHDLNNNRERILAHPVLRAMAGDPSAIAPLPPEALRPDFDSRKPEACQEVVDSDSSQEEAVNLSRLGVSFVMQGPPGTGKSQTITNIIAEALAAGKKVLFVSEKAAALQVVLKRLTETGLDDFCLSLHNYRANKKEIIDSIGANLGMTADYHPEDAAGSLAELFHDRQFLNDYAGQLHEKLPPLNRSAYEVFGTLAGLEKATEVPFALDDPAAVGKTELAEMQYRVADLEKALRHLGGPISANPWHGTKAVSSSQAYRQELLLRTRGLSENLRAAAEKARALGAMLGASPDGSYAGTLRLTEAAGMLTDGPAFMRRGCTEPAALWSARVDAANARDHAARLDQIKQVLLRQWDPAVTSLDPAEAEPLLRGELSWACQSEDGSPAELLGAELERLKVLTELLSGASSAFVEGCELIRYPARPDCMPQLEMLGAAFALICSAPYLEASWFEAGKNELYSAMVREAAEKSAALRSEEAGILKDWEPAVFELDASALTAHFKVLYTGPLRFLRPDYRQDTAQILACSRTPGVRLSEGGILELLRKVQRRNRMVNWFREKESDLREALGSQYRGEWTNWESVKAGLEAAPAIAGVFLYGVAAEQTAEAISAVTKDPDLMIRARRVRELLCPETVRQAYAALRKCHFSSLSVPGESVSGTILPELRRMTRLCSRQMEFLSSVRQMKKSREVSGGDLRELADRLGDARREQQWFRDNDKALQSVFPSAVYGAQRDWNAIFSAADAAKRLSSLFDGRIPEPILRLACGEEAPDPSLRTLTGELESLLQAVKPGLSAFWSQFDRPDLASLSLAEAAAHYDACINDFLSLSNWLDYAEARRECDKLGLGQFTRQIADRDNSVPDVSGAFERGFYTQWLNRQLNRIPAVSSFRRRIHEQRAARFAALDTRQYEIARERIRAGIIRTFPDVNSVAGAGSELSILRHEMEKKRRIMPLRKLFHSIPTLLLTLKPCLMMSPLSVAYFLDANDYRFDMVIFDEASQIFPQDAIGAIFRAKQVIIAGDTRQLPPTNFFAAGGSQGEEEPDDDDGENTVYDSILEEAANVLPSRPLLWHYRSRYEHLIAFSNQEIYKNQLVTFPSSTENEPDTGVEFVHVPDGYYEPSPQNCNMQEAQRIAALVEQHVRTHPERSLGVIAFSEKQQQAIASAVQRLRENHPEYEEFFAEGKEAEFFVKNLENVQGDERDTIFFSVGYAKTKEQKANNRPMSLRFGPLGTSGGERRLNVAITRARINIKLVSSILPSDIDLSRTESEGIRMLRAYMEFALNGEAALASSRQSPDGDTFVNAVAKFIRESGYEVQTYVGCSGCRLDIAVRDPADPKRRYAAAVLCDGLSYASARTARDRDRLRSSVLKGMGWNLYRVWSPEWYNNPQLEGQKLLAFLRQAAG